MKKGFTLAEILITLGIIGIVAAMTIPTLVTKVQKHIYYTQFMKARSVIENALRLYANDHNCPASDPLCSAEDDVVEEFSRYFNGARLISEDNADDICSGYNKLPISWNHITEERDPDDWYSSSTVCNRDIGFEYLKDYNGFITLDGLLIILPTDRGSGCCSFVDVNGPDTGPNIAGRDIFSICLIGSEEDYCGNRWGFTEECMERQGTEYCNCFGVGSNGNASDTCGARLIKEGKMTY